jgi:hypothetical protein
MNPRANRPRLFLMATMALGLSIPAFGTVTYTCDASVNATVAGLCNALNTTVAGFYNNTFTNANATIYIQLADNGGLGESSGGYLNTVSYSTYRSTLQTESTDPAKSTLPSTEPTNFTGGSVELTSALKDAMGIGGTTVGTEFDPTGNANSGWVGAGCTTPGDGAVIASPTATSCYNGVITVNTPSALKTETGNQGLFFPGLLAGNGTVNYDFFAVVEHETDEILGTTSCIDRSNAGLTQTCGVGTPSVNDLFRYTAPGVRTFDTVGGSQYFSADGGTTDYQGNHFPNALGNGDWADFSSGCTFVQDSSGCPTATNVNTQFDITTDGPGGTAGPEIAMLNAVGYNLIQSPTPEPGTLGLLGVSLAAILVGRKRLSQK